MLPGAVNKMLNWKYNMNLFTKYSCLQKVNIKCIFAETSRLIAVQNRREESPDTIEQHSG